MVRAGKVTKKLYKVYGFLTPFVDLENSPVWNFRILMFIILMVEPNRHLS